MERAECGAEEGHRERKVLSRDGSCSCAGALGARCARQTHGRLVSQAPELVAPSGVDPAQVDGARMQVTQQGADR